MLDQNIVELGFPTPPVDPPAEAIRQVDRRIVPISPNMSMIDGNLEFEFFDGQRYNQALGGRTP